MRQPNTGAKMEKFTHINEWVFDLDNTLYPRETDLFSQIDWRMTDFVEELTKLPREDARKLQKQLYRDHGTTLNGLMVEHDVDPHAYLAYVHDIDYSPVKPNPALGSLIAQLPGRKHIFTNGDVPHAEKTLAALGIEPFFDSMFDIVAADFEPKPSQGAYQRFLADHLVMPERASMFEDMPRNLEVPKKLGMTTVLISPGEASRHQPEAWETTDDTETHIDFVTDNLDQFLQELLQQLLGKSAAK